MAVANLPLAFGVLAPELLVFFTVTRPWLDAKDVTRERFWDQVLDAQSTLESNGLVGTIRSTVMGGLPGDGEESGKLRRAVRLLSDHDPRAEDDRLEEAIADAFAPKGALDAVVDAAGRTREPRRLYRRLIRLRVSAGCVLLTAQLAAAAWIWDRALGRSDVRNAAATVCGWYALIAVAIVLAVVVLIMQSKSRLITVVDDAHGH